MKDFLNKVFGDDSSRFLKLAKPLVQQINNLEESMIALADADFPIKTEEFKNELQQEKPWRTFFLRLLHWCERLQSEP